MKKQVPFILAFVLTICLAGRAQTITYSEPDRDDARAMNFEVLGKLNGNILVYKNYRDQHFIAVYDNDMKQVERVKLDFLNGNKILNTEFIQYPDYVYMFYQFQRKSLLYCMAVKLDAGGKRTGEPKLVDTTEIGYSS